MSAAAIENPGASARAIEHHYDAGNSFYELWLDRTRTYSCALFEGEDETLEQAQVRKLDYHIAQAMASGARRVLDVGCGWGSTLVRLAGVHGVERVVGLTLSRSQAEHVRALGLQQIDVRIESWSEHAPGEPYDAVISIGAFEHFARPDLSPDQKVAGYRAFFQRCHEWLRPGGRLSLQTMTYENSCREDISAFFTEEIFPESDLPRLAEIVSAADGLFEVVALRSDRAHYARTLKEWRRRLRARRTEVVAAVGEQGFARYDKYLQLAMIGFHIGTMGLLRLGFSRIDRPYRRPYRPHG